ncbi:Leucine-rich repeat receptor-like protein kinase TDR [Linum perenne]
MTKRSNTIQSNLDRSRYAASMRAQIRSPPHHRRPASSTLSSSSELGDVGGRWRSMLRSVEVEEESGSMVRSEVGRKRARFAISAARREECFAEKAVIETGKMMGIVVVESKTRTPSSSSSARSPMNRRLRPVRRCHRLAELLGGESIRLLLTAIVLLHLRRICRERELDVGDDRRETVGPMPCPVSSVFTQSMKNFSPTTGVPLAAIRKIEVSELQNLRTLDISHNNFNSTFPPGISKLKFLRVFNAYSNSFTGALPREFMFLRFLEQMNLGGSYFEAEIPIGYGSFPRLKFLHIGTLPVNLGSNGKLQWLDVSSNFLMGKIPASLCKGNKLYKLILFSHGFSESMATLSPFASIGIGFGG